MTGALNRYLIRRFSLWLLIVTAGFGAVTVLGDLLEMLRLTSRFDLGAGTAVLFTLQRLPLLIIDLLPFIFLFAAMFCLLRLSQAQELAVIRAAGLSVWQFLKPFLLFTFILAALIVTLLEPLGAHTNAMFTAEKERLSGVKQQLSLSTAGIWFREASDVGNFIIRADRLDEADATRLVDVSVTVLDDNGQFNHRLEAETAMLTEGSFVLQSVRRLDSGGVSSPQAILMLPTQLQPDSLQAGFRPPRAVNIWQLPRYIDQAGAAGIDVTRHEARLQALLATPVLLLAMVMVAACFSLPTGRLISTGQTIGLSIVCGFLLYLFNDFVGLMAELDIMPPILAGWVPALIALLLSVSYLLTTEDG